MQVNKHFQFSLRAQRFAYGANLFVAQLGSTAARYAATGPPPNRAWPWPRCLGHLPDSCPAWPAGGGGAPRRWMDEQVYAGRCLEGRSPTGRPERQVWTMTGQEIKKSRPDPAGAASWPPSQTWRAGLAGPGVHCLRRCHISATNDTPPQPPTLRGPVHEVIFLVLAVICNDNN